LLQCPKWQHHSRQLLVNEEQTNQNSIYWKNHGSFIFVCYYLLIVNIGFVFWWYDWIYNCGWFMTLSNVLPHCLMKINFIVIQKLLIWRSLTWDGFLVSGPKTLWTDEHKKKKIRNTLKVIRFAPIISTNLHQSDRRSSFRIILLLYTYTVCF
jgi:hypothetical protein